MANGTTRDLAAVTLLSVLCACGPAELGAAPEAPADPLHADEQEIVGGTNTNEYPAVVAVGDARAAFCTGTLIGKQTVLTAAHCVEDLPANTAMRVLFGSNVGSPQRVVNATQFFFNPAYRGAGGGNDIALLRLATPVTDVTPIAINTTPMTNADVGKTILHVGFGLNNAQAQSGFGIKREVTFGVRQVNQNEYESGTNGAQTCNGDSGGPGLMVTAGNTLMRVVGTVSYGDQACAQVGFDSRVDTAASYIINTAAAWERLPTCAADTLCAPGCVPADVDCACEADGVCGATCADKTTDPDCLATGTACTAANQCQGNQCVSDANRPAQYCSRACSVNTDCPNDMTCSSGVCRFAQRAVELELGQACTPSDICKGGNVCVAPAAGGQAVCQIPCPTGTCGGNQTCVQGSGGVQYCRAAAAGTPGSNIGAVPGPAGGVGSEVPGEQVPGQNGAAGGPGTVGADGRRQVSTVVTGGCSAGAAGVAGPGALWLLLALAARSSKRRRNAQR